MQYICTYCHLTKSLDDFKKRNGKLSNKCNICRNLLNEKQCLIDKQPGEKEKKKQRYERWYQQIKNDPLYVSKKKQLGKEYHSRNKDIINKKHRNHHLALKIKAFEHYGGRMCCLCGETDLNVLCIDHVQNNGNIHRKQLGPIMGAKMHRWLRDNNYPSGFQVLCCNCNWAKHRNKGILPESRRKVCAEEILERLCTV